MSCGEKVAELIDLPINTDPHHRLLMKTCSELAMISYTQGNKDLMAILRKISVINSVEKGNCPESPTAYTAFGGYLCLEERKFQEGLQFGQLALALVDKLHCLDNLPFIHFNFAWFIASWTLDRSVLIKHLVKTIQVGSEQGDLMYTSFAAIFVCHCDTRLNLEASVQNDKTYQTFLNKTNFLNAINSGTFYHNYRRALVGDPRTFVTQHREI